MQGKEAQGRLRGVLKKYMLRRNKSLISKRLSRKTDMVVYCNLSPWQLRAYQ